MSDRKEKKRLYVQKLRNLIDNNTKILLVGADNVGSAQIQCIRKRIRNVDATLLMGKNTMIRRVIRLYYPNLETLLPYLLGNVGMVFTNGDLGELRAELLAERVGAFAKAGAIAPCNVVIPKGDTGLEPTQTATLQALNIATRINRGQIMVLNDKLIVTEGEKVGSSEANLLQKLGIKPFSYGLTVQTVYDDGFVYDAKILDITDDDLIAKFSSGVTNIACVSLSIGLPTLASVPHSISRAYKNILAIALDTEVTFKQAQEIKDILADPEKLAALAAAAPAAAGGDAEEAAPAEEEEEEESDADMGFSLFG